ncbi:ferrochelatase [Angustibacter luteus]|uniref:Coproporphyrin III ferrochelatase n=1 Tax=Angustibacter luteus TaxID=658456 RepID=A0ABW1J8W7_9ACTN
MSAATNDSLDPYDSVLLLSFGGPEGPDDVLPFLRNVTAGRGIPDDRLAEVAEHYALFDGRSPINDQNRALLAALRTELDGRGLDQPLLWGNRNWAPYVTDALREAHDAGHRRVLVVTTSAYSSYSSCRQYREDLAGAVLTLAAEGRGLDVAKVRPYFNHPGFVEPNAEAALQALAQLPAGAHLVFVTHSVPDVMDEASGPGGDLSPAYSEQHRDVAAVVADAVGRELGHAVPWELVYCSRSGPPSQPWLEPDVGDHLRALQAAGVPGAAVCPIGFVSDHLEVVYDLDTEAREVADEIGLPFARAATVGTDRRFVTGLVDLLVERAAQARGGEPERPSLGSRGPTPSTCPVGCCQNLRASRPAACGEDWTSPLVAGGAR